MNLTKNLKKKFIPILPKLFPIYVRGRKTHLFYDVSFSLIPKPDKESTSKLQANIPDEQRAKILNKILANQIQQYIKSIINTMVKWDLSQWCKNGSTDMIYHINKIKHKDDMISRSVEKANIFFFKWKFQYPFMIRALNKVNIQGHYCWFVAIGVLQVKFKTIFHS